MALTDPKIRNAKAKEKTLQAHGWKGLVLASQ